MKPVSVLRTCGVGILFLGAMVVFSQSGSAQADPSVGTWQLNVAKSKYDPGPAPKSNTVTIEAAGQGVKVSTKGVDAAGNPTGTQYTTALDGKDTPVTLTGSQDYDSVSFKRIDERTVEGTRKKADKVVQTYSRVVSQDGKTMTITTKGTNAKGEKVNNVAVYEKK
jgi:hypothetical protein